MPLHAIPKTLLPSTVITTLRIMFHAWMVIVELLHLSFLLLRCPPLLLGEADPSPRFGTHSFYTRFAAGTVGAGTVEGGNGLIDAVSLCFQLADDTCCVHAVIVQEWSALEMQGCVGNQERQMLMMIPPIGTATSLTRDINEDEIGLEVRTQKSP